MALTSITVYITIQTCLKKFKIPILLINHCETLFDNSTVKK